MLLQASHRVQAEPLGQPDTYRKSTTCWSVEQFRLPAPIFQCWHVIILGLLFATFCSSSWGQAPATWNGATSGYWHDASRWSTAVVPDADTQTIFNTLGSYSVSWNNDSSAGDLIITNNRFNDMAFVAATGRTHVANGDTILNQAILNVGIYYPESPIPKFQLESRGSAIVDDYSHITLENADWNISSNLLVGVNTSSFRSGRINVLNGSTLHSETAQISSYADEFSSRVIVAGIGSAFEVDGGLTVGTSGTFGQAHLQIQSEATLRTGSASLAGRGTIVYIDGQSVWENNGNLDVGTSDSHVNILIGAASGNALVRSTGLTTIHPGFQGGSNVSVENNSRFEFGEMSRASFGQVSVDATSRVQGDVIFTGNNTLSSINTSLNIVTPYLNEVRVANNGNLSGSGQYGFGLKNERSGELRTLGNETVRFGGSTENLNAGRILNFGGLVEFESYLVNTGTINGRGIFVGRGGWENQGSMGFSGTTDVVGSVFNGDGKLIVTSGGATTTFYDRVINYGDIKTSANSHTVFFDFVNGSSFSGEGHAYFEGGFSPGFSPGVAVLGGNLTLGSSNDLLIEVGGTNYGQFDKMLVAGDLNLDGTLSIALWDDFELGYGMSFLIADVAGTRFGTFQGLGEGSLVGNFSGHDLFITYGAGGNGQGIALFTAVPEPSGFLLVGLGCTILLRRSRRKASAIQCR
ncbi:MAG: hypothetical protein JNK57_21650 [Planctomycetaceae bacterium]|nr:hypothetical protein [Planctomycetaceae bacterium]